MRRVPRRTLIEHHHDVRSDGSLGIDDVFRGKRVVGPIYMGLKRRSFFGQFAPVREGKDLIATRVGENGTLPVHKWMQTTGSREDVKTWT